MCGKPRILIVDLYTLVAEAVKKLIELDLVGSEVEAEHADHRACSRME